MKYEGRLLNLGTVDLCNRKFAEDCKINFPEKVPVTYNFQSGPEYVLGNAEISRDENGLNCKVTLCNEYFTDNKKHKDVDITVIDSCRLASMSIVPDNQCCNKNNKISRVDD